jgi:hypothetical protein
LPEPYLDKGEDLFLVMDDPQRAKGNIEHWAPIGTDFLNPFDKVFKKAYFHA